MGKQVHFVVVVDLDEKAWWVDDDTFMARFDKDEGTWDTDTLDWRATTDEENSEALEILKPITSQE